MGQLYTGMSRIKTLDNLCLIGDMSAGMPCCHPLVCKFELDTVWTTIANRHDDEQVPFYGVADEE